MLAAIIKIDGSSTCSAKPQGKKTLTRSMLKIFPSCQNSKSPKNVQGVIHTPYSQLRNTNFAIAALVYQLKVHEELIFLESITRINASKHVHTSN
uniref:Uncharacterized protein n=1 Tax=Rhizophora mucronata TaxID=61149 RepID=A0A2P2L9A4_RHIMU